MTEKEYKVIMDIIYRDLADLPDHKPEEIDAAYHQLSGMNADLGIGRLEIDAAAMGKADVRKQMLEIERLSFEELENTRNIEKAYDSSQTPEEWSRYSKVNRAELLLKQYSLLCRLRSDDPEAWDEVNELFFDD